MVISDTGITINSTVVMIQMTLSNIDLQTSKTFLEAEILLGIDIIEDALLDTLLTFNIPYSFSKEHL